MLIGGGPDTCRKQITFDYPNTMTGQVRAARSARRAGRNCGPSAVRPAMRRSRSLQAGITWRYAGGGAGL